jgi:carboxymethylenebutenolidase
MDGPEIGLEGFSTRTQWSRRGFVMTSLITGFALSMQPVSAETITTDTNGLDADEVKVPVAEHPARDDRKAPGRVQNRRQDL